MNRFVLVLIFSLASKLWGSVPVERSDLKALGSQIVCDGESREPAFDAQVIIRTVTGTVTEEALANLAKTLASRHEHLGFGVGVCHSGRGFVVSAPAPVSWPEFQAAGAKHRDCRRISEVFQGATPKARAGVQSVTCYRRERESTRSSLWFLAPVGISSVADLEVPFINKVGDQNSFVMWVNTVRKSQALSPVRLKPRADLRPSFTLAHRKNFISRLKSFFSGRGERFVGELRVIAGSWQLAAKLLWRSPTHRQLLLSERADAIRTYLAHKENEGSLFVFWITGVDEEAV